MAYPQVVRVYCTYKDYDYECPWQSLAPRSSSGSGVLIGPDRILTGAHVVANATFLQVQKISDPDKVVATVEAISHDSDLALLRFDDPEFAAGVEPARVGDMPELRDEVQVVGFPVGGDEISITEGVVSRIEVQRYEHSQRYMLAVTVDAAINEGNSGGPVFYEGEVAGVAFQSLVGAENIGEMVPAPVIRRFLDGVGQGKSPDVPGLGISTQNLENPWLRDWLGMDAGTRGVLVTTVQYGTTCWGHVEKGDVLVQIDGLPIANNGTVRYRDHFRCQYDVVVGDHFVGDTLRAVVLRNGKRRELEMEMQPMEYLVPRYEFGRIPAYFICGGLVFQRLTQPYLAIWGDHWWDRAPKEFLHLYYSGDRKPERQEVVFLAQVLADEINVGYEHLANDAVVEINGSKPVDLGDFVTRVESVRGPIVIRTSSGNTILLDSEEVRTANARILAQYEIPRDRSPDLPARAGQTARTGVGASERPQRRR